MNWVAQTLSAVASVLNPLSLCAGTHGNYVCRSYCNQAAHLMQNAFKTSERKKIVQKERENVGEAKRTPLEYFA